MSLFLGIDESHALAYESHSAGNGHLIWPLPVISPARFVNGQGKAPDLGYGSRFYFREDVFDPVARLRRGRFYRGDGNTRSWHVLPSPWVIQPRIGDLVGDMLRTTPLIECQNFMLSNVPGVKQGDVGVRLGDEQWSTDWRIVQAEKLFTGEEIVTLKATRSFGILPDVNWNRLPENAISTIRAKLEVLEDEFNRAGAESVVDRAREAATAILSAYLQQQEITQAQGEDLGNLVGLLEKHSGKNGQRVIACAAEIPQRLHSRAKHAEQERRNTRAIRDQDAELAVQCIGVMLCDLGWANWR